MTTILLVFCFVVIAAGVVRAQVSGVDRDAATSMLDMTRDAIKKNYYDTTFHGVDVDFVFQQARG